MLLDYCNILYYITRASGALGLAGGPLLTLPYHTYGEPRIWFRAWGGFRAFCHGVISMSAIVQHVHQEATVLKRVLLYYYTTILLYYYTAFIVCFYIIIQTQHYVTILCRN